MFGPNPNAVHPNENIPNVCYSQDKVYFSTMSFCFCVNASYCIMPELSFFCFLHRIFEG